MAPAAKRAKTAPAPLFTQSASFDSELDSLFAAGSHAPPPAPQIEQDDEDEQDDEQEDGDEDDDEDGEQDGEQDGEEDDEEDDEEEDEDREENVDEDNEEDNDASDASVAETKEIMDAFDLDEQDVAENTKSARSRRRLALEGADESDVQRNKRTIFLGNVPMETINNRAARKQLIRHIEKISPYPECTRVVSLRFRSVSFSVPTTNLMGESEEAENASIRRRERARKFRELQGLEPRENQNSQPLLTTQQKRKVAFINHNLNDKAQTVNAYARLGTPSLVHQHSGNTDALDPRLSGAILAALVAAAANNSLFGGRHLRADVVQPLETHEMITAGLDQKRLPDGSYIGGHNSGSADLKRTAFIGNLDFETNEEEVRELFERIVREERGPPPAVQTSLRLDEADTTTLPGSWVQSVRIVRDKATQLGKGFAYVKFLDPICVDEVIAVHEAEEAFIAAARPQKAGAHQAPVAKPIELAEGEEFRRRLKLRKRALRVSRCKNSAEIARRAQQQLRTPRVNPRVRSSGAPSPGGTSPTIARARARPAETRERAEYLGTLTKEQRAAAKKNDADRQARRLQKKQDKVRAAKVAAVAGKGRERVRLPQRAQAKAAAKRRAK